MNFFDRINSKWYLYFFEGEGGAGGGGKDKVETLEEVAARVAKEQGLTDDEEKPEEKEKPKEKEKEKEKETEEEETEEEDEDELDEVQKRQAHDLFKVLNNPKTAKDALLMLVRAAGLKVDDATVKEQKQVAKTIKDVVKDKLGQKYEFLSEDLGDLLQELFDSAITEKTKDIEDKIASREKKETEKEVQSAYDTVVNSYSNINEKILKEVLKIQKSGELVLGPNTNPEKYFRAVFAMAAETVGVSLVKKGAKQETTSSTKRKDVSAFSRLNSQSGLTHKEGLKETQVKSLDDIIKATAEKVEAEMTNQR